MDPLAWLGWAALTLAGALLVLWVWRHERRHARATRQWRQVTEAANARAGARQRDAQVNRAANRQARRAIARREARVPGYDVAK